MDKNQLITVEYFSKRLTDLCLRSGMNGFPSDSTAQHILLKSIALTLEQSRIYKEKEINEAMDHWLGQVAGMKEEDFGSLRRRLVDAGYLVRTTDGARYQVSTDSPQLTFDAAIEKVDVFGLIRSGREEIDRRRRMYLEKSGTHPG